MRGCQGIDEEFQPGKEGYDGSILIDCLIIWFPMDILLLEWGLLSRLRQVCWCSRYKGYETMTKLFQSTVANFSLLMSWW